jgi:CRP-like cAMP-binding protein
MLIDYNILIAYGGTAKKIDKGEIIYEEGAHPRYFYQIVEGEVKIFSTNTEGKILIQGIYTKGQSFGAPPLLLEKPYANSAQATTNCVIVRINKDKLFNILEDFPDVSKRLIINFAERIYYKAALGQIWGGHNPEEKIEQFLIQHKKNSNYETRELVPFTRQQIADFTGLRVETVIRTLKKMSEQGMVDIIDRKLYY